MVKISKNQDKLRRMVLTGGPGVGKTTVLEILANKGYKILPEAARLIIEKESSKKNSDCLPWKNLEKFQRKVFALQIKLENSTRKGIVFSDRGIIDNYAYAELGKVKVPNGLMAKGKDRYEKIFLLNPLPFYRNDADRKEDVAMAKEIHKEIKEAYKLFGYDPIHVPVLPPENRTEFILSHLDL